MAFLLHNLILVIIFLFTTEFFDQLDGIVARIQGPTKFGAFLDSTLDRIGDFLIFAGLILAGYTTIEIGFLVLIGAFLTSYTRAKIEALGVDNLYGIGLIESFIIGIRNRSAAQSVVPNDTNVPTTNPVIIPMVLRIRVKLK